jgi:hypothetical protein
MRADRLEDGDGHGGQMGLRKGMGKVEAVQPRTRLATTLTATLRDSLGTGNLGNLGFHGGERLNHPNRHGGQGLLHILGNVPSNQLLGGQLVILGNLDQKITGVTLKLILDASEEVGKAGHGVTHSSPTHKNNTYTF